MTILARASIERLLATSSALTPELAAKLSCPFVVDVPGVWWSSRHRLAIYGQETNEWHSSLLEAKATDGIVDELASFYEGFDFAEEAYPRVRSSPFWRAHRQLADRLEDGEYRRIVWLNLVKVDCSGAGTSKASMWDNLSYAEVDAVAAWQKETILAELAELHPSAVIFFTGPRYDYYLNATFDGIGYSAVSEYTEKQLARLSHSLLPAMAFRTYHPGYLQRSGQWSTIERLAALISA
ncbi:hypothetical protein ACUN0C_11490 [Faunimonas sp. B44]|uniref:hypothetical protein n=1 Tax=Faunimonas sp. B44 TaxID=3461493 RepID=UPI004043C058